MQTVLLARFSRCQLWLAVAHEEQVKGLGDHILHTSALLGRHTLELATHFLGKVVAFVSRRDGAAAGDGP
jgi:hypothetical protein